MFDLGSRWLGARVFVSDSGDHGSGVALYRSWILSFWSKVFVFWSKETKKDLMDSGSFPIFVLAGQRTARGFRSSLALKH